MKYKIKKVLRIKNFFLVFIFYGDLFSKPIGLKNLGNSCYMNSVLQVLAHTDDFKEYFLNNDFDEGSNPLSFAFKNFLEEYFKNKDNNYFVPEKLYNAIQQQYKTKSNSEMKFANNNQHDPEEFLTIFLDSLETENNKWNNIFKGKETIFDTCKNCKAESQKENEIIFWCLGIKDDDLEKIESHEMEEDCCNCCDCCCVYYKTALEKLLDNYKKEEEIESNCVGCKNNTKKGRITKISFLPKYLILQFKIYNHHSVFIKIPKELNLKKYCTEQNNVNFDYTLYGIVRHHGNKFSGHYTAAIKEGNDWYICDDKTVEKVIKPSLDDGICSRRLSPPGTYLLFYKEKKENENPLSEE